MHQTIGSLLGKPTGWLGVILGRLMDISNAQLNDSTLELLDVQPTDRVLEIGFGSGRTIRRLATMVRQGAVCGLDYSETMVRQANRRNAAAVRSGRVSLVQGDAADLPYPDESFDKMCSVHCIYFWPSPPDVLRELWRVLKPGGRVVIAIASPASLARHQRTRHFPRFSGEDVAAMLQTAGFRQTRVDARADGFCILGCK